MQAELIETITNEGVGKVGVYDTHITEKTAILRDIRNEVKDAIAFSNNGRGYMTNILQNEKTIQFVLSVCEDEDLPEMLISSDEEICARIVRMDYGDFLERDTGYRYGYNFRIDDAVSDISDTITIEEMYERFKEKIKDYTSEEDMSVEIRTFKRLYLAEGLTKRICKECKYENYTESVEIWLFMNKPLEKDVPYVPLGIQQPEWKREK